jgi:hypothetical protein
LRARPQPNASLNRTATFSFADLIAIVGVGAALSLAAALVELDIPGRVKLLGTPAEENGGGKVILIREGAYDDMTGEWLDATSQHRSYGRIDCLGEGCGHINELELIPAQRFIFADARFPDTACMMAHPEGGRSAESDQYDGGVGTTLAVTGFTADVSHRSRSLIALCAHRPGADLGSLFGLSSASSSRGRPLTLERTRGLGSMREPEHIVLYCARDQPR